MSGNSEPGAWPSGLLIIDKPGGMTSHDVVARVRRLARTRRVGHAGTLDPMATGVLVIGIEKATRLLGHLLLTEKTYQATIRLGQSTTTDDAEGELTGGSPASQATREGLDTEVAKLTGEILQVPSSVSAIKVNGQRAYKLTRAGEAPELAARPVTIHEFHLTAVRQEGDFLDIDATIRCSSGTYIRALARDLGTALGTGGHLTALRRTAVGPYPLAQAHTLDELQDQVQSAERERLTPQAPVIPLAQAAAAAFPRLDLTAEDALRLAHGARLPLPSSLRTSANPQPQCPPLGPATPEPPAAVSLRDEPIGAMAHSAKADIAPGATALNRPDVPLATFAPDGTLVALVTADAGRLRSLAVFVDASQQGSA